MSKVRYVLNETNLIVSEEAVISYGVSCLENEKLISKIQDISPNKKEVEKLVNLCNKLKLEPCHLIDVAEDYVL